jgi:hypothetical protein
MSTLHARDTIRSLRERAAKLIRLADELAEEYGEPMDRSVVSTRNGTPSIESGGSTREDQIIDLIRVKGPQRTGEIQAATGIPLSSVKYMLPRSVRFVRLSDKRWGIAR